MSKVKLISQGSAYDELFDTATYIQEDNGVGIYPAYENALRDNTLLSYITVNDITKGTIILNVPTGQTFGYLQIPKTSTEYTKEYDIYVKSSVALKKVSVFKASSPFTTYYSDSTISTTYEGSFTVSEDADIRSILEPQSADFDTDIYIEYTIIPKGYPKLQEWAGSQLTDSLDSDVKSISFQLSDYLASVGFRNMIQINSTATLNSKMRFSAWTANSTQMYIRLHTDDINSYVFYLYTYNASDIMTWSYTTNASNLYINNVLVKTTPVSWDSVPSFLTTLNSDVGYIVIQLVTSTEESTGYPAGTIINIEPTCKLGLAGAEVELPKESRIQSTVNRIVKKLESESANATPYTQYIATKDIFEINYEMISDANLKAIKAIEALQWENNTRLSYIYNEESGNLITKTVRATVNTGGNRILRDRYFNSGLSIELKE